MVSLPVSQHIGFYSINSELPFRITTAETPHQYVLQIKFRKKLHMYA